MAASDPPKMISVTMHEVIKEDFEQWLESRGLRLLRFPESIQDDPELEGFFVGPGQELWESMTRGGHGGE